MKVPPVAPGTWLSPPKSGKHWGSALSPCPARRWAARARCLTQTCPMPWSHQLHFPRALLWPQTPRFEIAPGSETPRMDNPPVWALLRAHGHRGTRHGLARQRRAACARGRRRHTLLYKEDMASQGTPAYWPSLPLAPGTPEVTRNSSELPNSVTPASRVGSRPCVQARPSGSVGSDASQLGPPDSVPSLQGAGPGSRWH